MVITQYKNGKTPIGLQSGTFPCNFGSPECSPEHYKGTRCQRQMVAGLKEETLERTTKWTGRSDITLRHLLLGDRPLPNQPKTTQCSLNGFFNITHNVYHDELTNTRCDLSSQWLV